jgi:hypothetical protein
VLFHISAFKMNLPVEIQPDNQVAVKLGHSQTILCKAAVALQVCRFTIPGEASLVLMPRQPSEDGIDYYGEGLDKGQCGVTISNIKERHDGNITCHLTPGKGRSESYNSVRMIVASGYYVSSPLLLHLLLLLHHHRHILVSHISFRFFHLFRARHTSQTDYIILFDKYYSTCLLACYCK